MDLTLFDSFETDILAGVAAVGAAYVGVTVATQAFPFIRSWIKRLRGAASR